jgi:hypothetical protein
MSTGLSIKSATYGTGSTTVDVTGAVTSAIKDGALNLPVTTSALNVQDPAPGQSKTLTINYSINNGKNNTLATADGGTATITAPPERDAGGLQIVSAEYGYTGNFTDVTDAVKNHLKDNGSINLKAGFKELGIPDPNPNKQKQLIVEYTLNGGANSKTLNDGETFKLSAPSAVGGSQKPMDFANSLIGSIFQGVTKFIGVFLFLLSMYTVVDYGKSFNSKIFQIPEMMWYIIGLIPYSSLWLIPMIHFWIALYMNEPIYTAKSWSSSTDLLTSSSI